MPARLRLFIAAHISLYRPEYVQGLQRVEDSYMPELCRAMQVPCPPGWVPTYSLGTLRAKVFGVRVPVLWACDQLIFAGLLK